MFKRFMLAAASLASAACMAAELPEEPVFIISSNSGQPYTQIIETFLSTMRANEGRLHRKFVFSVKSLDNHPARLDNKAFAPEMQQARYILVNGTIASMKVVELVGAQDPRKFVYCSVTDPVAVGLVGPKAGDTPHFTGVSFYLDPAERLGFVERLYPHARNLGLVYADMPQSHSYNGWLKQALENGRGGAPLHLVTQEIPFVQGAGGIVRMALLAADAAQRMEPLVDVFISPNDQLGLNSAYYETLGRVIRKPLIGIGVTDARADSGATASIAPSFAGMGRQCANMMLQQMRGTPVAEIPPQAPPEYEVLINMARARESGASPEYFVARCPHGGPLLHLMVKRGKGDKLDWSSLKCMRD